MTQHEDTKQPAAFGAPFERELGPLPTSAEDEAIVLSRLSKTPAEAYERGYMDGAARERERLDPLRAELHAANERYMTLLKMVADNMAAVKLPPMLMVCPSGK